MEVRRAIDHYDSIYEPKHTPTLIADGGIRNSGDIVKALAAGANSVMIGSLFAGTDESPGDIIIQAGLPYKVYRGMASTGAMSIVGTDRTAEGVTTLTPYKGSVINLVNELCGGIRSGLSYCNSESISELHEQDIEMIRVTQASQGESRPHGLLVNKE